MESGLYGDLFSTPIYDKYRLAETEGEEGEELRKEFEELEEHISELTEFQSWRSFQESATGG